MKKKWLLLLWSFILSALFIGLASKSSPLYPLNDWVDVNCFFTMGRSLLDGMVPYRDLYEQKGPILYFVFALVAMFSGKSYLGVYLLEVITYALFLFFSGLIARLYLKKTRIVYLLITVIAALLPMSWSFTHGGSVEQHCLFMLAYALYSFLYAIEKKRVLTKNEAILNGVFAGMLLWIKYTMLGFYLGLALFVLIWYPSIRVSFKGLMQTIGNFLLGVGVISAIVLVYFCIYGAVDELIRCYFYNNIFLYPSEFEGSRFTLILKCLKDAFKYNRSYAWMLQLGVLWTGWQLIKNWRTALMLLFSFAGLTIGTYWGCKGWDYYGFIFAAYSVLGLVGIVQLLRLCRVRDLLIKVFHDSPIPFLCLLTATTIFLVISATKHNRNLYLAGYSKEETVQYRFAQTINQVEDPTLLNYGFLDGGFYFASGAKPACRYFCYFNINPDEMWQEQKACIENGDADFIVTRKSPLTNYSPDSSQYQLVDQADFPFNNKTTYTYFLYQKIPE